MFEFKPISEAPIGENSAEQILCRFWYPYIGGHWVYFVAFPNGVNTRKDGYAEPEEFCLLPESTFS